MHRGGRVRGSVTRCPSVLAAEARTPPTAPRGVLTAAGEGGCQQGLHSVSGVLLKGAALCSRWFAWTGSRALSQGVLALRPAPFSLGSRNWEVLAWSRATVAAGHSSDDRVPTGHLCFAHLVCTRPEGAAEPGDPGQEAESRAAPATVDTRVHSLSFRLSVSSSCVLSRVMGRSGSHTADSVSGRVGPRATCFVHVRPASSH